MMIELDSKRAPTGNERVRALMREGCLIRQHNRFYHTNYLLTQKTLSVLIVCTTA